MTARERYDRMLSEEIRPVLRSAGFKKKRNKFVRELDGTRHSLEFQASPFGSRDDVRFTTNLGIDFEELNDPWQLRVRIGRLLPGGEDTWWAFDDATHVGDLAAQLVDVIEERALPWFDERATFTQAQQLLKRRPDLFDVGSLDRLAVLCRRAGFDELAAAARAEADRRRRPAP